MASIERWKDLLRIPSIGTDPAHRSDSRRAAGWLVDQLQALGFDAAARDTPGQPIVVGHHPGPDGAAAPRVLYYGHYDVQPPDRWTCGTARRSSRPSSRRHTGRAWSRAARSTTRVS